MPILTVQTEGHTKQEKPLLKGITLIGSDPFADIRILDPKVPRIVARIQRSLKGYVISSVGDEIAVHVNGTRVSKHEMTDKDLISIHDTRICFYENLRNQEGEAEPHNQELETYSRLAAFITRLSHETQVPTLLETLVDEIMALTKAERAFLVVLENEIPRVHVARNMHGETLNRSVNQMSDTILNRVLESKSPFVVSDALHDQEFNSSASVINFKLTSVMCSPLMAHGQLLGAIYVGNNGVINAFDDKSLKILSVFSGQAALIVKNALLVNALTNEAKELRTRLDNSKFGSLIGNCPAMQEVFQRVEKASQTQTNILISGEAGTGKELVARELHRRSGRRDGPFVVLNCAAIPEGLLESELFGHVRGAFNGAIATRFGCFQSAHGGTLFLDEVSELPLFLQAKLLRGLREQLVAKVGDTKLDKTDVRVIAASNKKVLNLVSKGLFREDLYYDLTVLPLEVPPLRERGNDVILIANYFIQKHSKIANKQIIGFTESAQNRIINYPWPGNVRELENAILRAVVLCESDRIGHADLNIDATDTEAIIPLADAVERFRNQYITSSLERNAGNRTRAAKELGVDPRTIFRHLEELKKSDMEPQSA